MDSSNIGGWKSPSDYNGLRIGCLCKTVFEPSSRLKNYQIEQDSLAKLNSLKEMQTAFFIK